MSEDEKQEVIGAPLIYFGPEPWDGLWRNRHQLMSRLAETDTAIYVEPPPYLRQLRGGRFSWREIWSLCKKKRLRRCMANLYIYSPPIFLPIIGREPFASWSWKAWFGLMTWHLQSIEVSEPVIILSRPYWQVAIKKCNEQLVVYHAVDEYSGYHGLSESTRQVIRDRERDTIRQSNLVVVVSANLLKAKSQINRNTVCIGNGVDYDAYQRAISSRDVPADIAEICTPRVGYTGLIADRLDLELLADMACARPEWSFVFVGQVDASRCQQQFEILGSFENVHFLGQKAVDELPDYVSAFDVCMIPYSITLRAEFADPLKLYEFAAAEKPIVATNFAAARRAGSILRIASNSDDFIRAIEASLSEGNDPEGAKRLREFASSSSWAIRTNMFRTAVMQSLITKRCIT